jgi:putative nucleotidyltransferase with HDIG domain
LFKAKDDDVKRTAFFKKLDAIRDLPTLPKVALEINKLLDNPGATIGQVSNIITKDQAIASKILRLVNSSFFGLETKVSTISRAVIILGFNTVRNALVSVSILKAMKRAQNKQVDLKLFWQHAISCAVVSKHLARSSHLGTPEDAFTAGLIHDIGKLVLAKYFPDQFIKIIDKLEMEHSSFYDSELNVIPVHHNEIGAHLARKWRLPALLCDAVNYSHGIFDFDAYPLACIVFCAEKMLASETFDDLTDYSIDLPQSKNIDTLRVVINNRNEWISVVKNEIQSACLFLMDGDNNGR